MIFLDGNSLTIENLIQVARHKERVGFSDIAKKRMEKTRRWVEEKIKEGKVMYGVNTGFGDLSSVKIPMDKIRKLQVNLLRSHAVGVGPELPEEVVRAMILLRANTLAKGHSGVRVTLAETLVAMLKKNILPVVPAQGSVGSSGDLAPLAHIGMGLIGEGEVIFQGKRFKASLAFKKAGLKPIILEAKEGLAFINGTQLMTAIGALAIFDAENLAQHADIAAAISIDAMKGSLAAADPLIHKVRPFKGQNEVAANLRALMQGSQILESHKNCDKVQDAYSMRCVPQVHGASRDTTSYARKIVETEMNSATDNPLVFADENKMVNGGNFHGQPVALAMDFLGIATAELANISERRIARLTDSKLSEGLPAFLVKNGGVNSGFMITQYTAASLVSENKVLAHPASVDSIPTSANKEDHVSMGTIAARKCREIVENSTQVIAIELLCGAQALEFHRPLKTSEPLMAAYETIRKMVPMLKEDRFLHPDLIAIKKLVKSDKITKAVQKVAKLK